MTGMTGLNLAPFFCQKWTDNVDKHILILSLLMDYMSMVLFAIHVIYHHPKRRENGRIGKLDVFVL